MGGNVSLVRQDFAEKDMDVRTVLFNKYYIRGGRKN